MEIDVNKKQAVGVLIICRTTGRVLLLQRSSSAGHSHLWSLLSGGLDDGEKPINGIAREIREEISVNPNIINFFFINKESTERNDFFYYIGLTNTEFKPILDFENEDWGWFKMETLPKPMFPGLREKIVKALS